MKNSSRIALAASALWLAFLWLGGYDHFELHEMEGDELSTSIFIGLVVIWLLKFLLGTFVDKNGKDDPIALIIHWGIYGAIIAFLTWLFIIEGERLSRLEQWVVLAAICIGPPAIFTIIYWIVTKRWAIFPWQHVKKD